MQRILSVLVLIAFSLVAQMPFVHALDMGMGHEMVSVDSSSQDAVLCGRDGTTPAQSCFTEIAESKWVRSVEREAIIGILIVSLFVHIFSYSSRVLGLVLRASFRRWILYYETLYLGLYGIVRSVR